MELQKKEKAIIGCLLGTAVGDSLGLPCEGMSKRRQRRIFYDIDRYNFFFGKGMVSDDTEHTLMVASALMETGGEPSLFIKNLSWKLRLWFLKLPAGVGMATLKSCLKLWIGFSGEKSGVFSAGNGPAMRSAIMGVLYGDNPEKMKNLVRASTRITHTDPKAEFGAMAVALAAYMAGNQEFSPEEYYRRLALLLGTEAEEFLLLVKKALDSYGSGKTTEHFAETLGLGKGVSGYIYHTVPVVLYGWFKNSGDFSDGLKEIIRCGGDTDTTGAIFGAITGAGVGKKGIPEEWINNIMEWPMTVK